MRRHAARALALVATFAWAGRAPAAPAHLLKDVNTTPLLGNATVIAAGGEDGRIFFAVLQRIPGPVSSTPLSAGKAQLWITDGTADGTTLLRDNLLSLNDMTVGGGRAFFRADDGVHGVEPWISDGTPGGTRLILDIVPGPDGSFHQFPVFVRDRFFFPVTNPRPDVYGLWESDGTPEGTVPVRTIPSATGGPARTFGFISRALGSVVAWFDDGVHGAEPWITDGTPEGTRFLGDLYPGRFSSIGQAGVAELDGAMYFSASTESGSKLWRSDGTAEGTTIVSETGPDRVLRRAGGLLFYDGRDAAHGHEPWRSDGTPQGTFSLGDLYPGPNDSFPAEFVGAGGAAYFTVYDPVHGTELWRSDGTASGTALLKDIRPGGDFSGPSNLRMLGDRLFFQANDGVHGVELWRSDGSAAGTALFADLNPGPGAGIGGFRLIGSNLFFTSDDGVHGAEPWMSDGTTAGTRLLAELNPFVGNNPSNPREIVDVRGAPFFVLGRELWRTAGTPESTHFVSPYVGCCMIPAGDKLFFLGDGMRVSDGTELGTVLFSSLVPEFDDPSSEPILAIGNRALLLDPIANELWSSDGTASGTARLVTADWGFWGALNGLGFIGLGGPEGVELWRSDGTIEGTRLVRDLRPGPESSMPVLFTPARDSMYFLADDGNGAALWRSDGTPEGTTHLRTLSGGFPSQMTGLGSRLLFTMAGSELWKSDGTPGGTGLLRSFDTVWIDTLVGGASRAYFRVYLGGTLFGDYELWTTDGTAEGTVPLGTFPREPVNPQAVVVDDVLLFAAYERSLPFSGPRRLWRSDGTVEGTRPILDVTPAEFARVGNRLYFSGDDGVHGAEPWVGWVNVLLERPAAAVADLRAETAALGLPRGTTNDLLAKLDTATRALARGEFRGVRDALEKFVRQLTRVPRHETDAGAIDEAIRFARDILELPAIAG